MIEITNKLLLLHLVGCLYYNKLEYLCSNKESSGSIIREKGSKCIHKMLVGHFSVPFTKRGHQPAAPSVRYTTGCKHSLVLLRMGEIIA